jgi:hypothetical protein
MAESSTSSTGTNPNTGSSQGHLWDEPEPSESSTTQPVKRDLSSVKNPQVEETAEEEVRRKKYFDNFAKRFFKVDGANEVFKKDDQARRSQQATSHSY